MNLASLDPRLLHDSLNIALREMEYFHRGQFSPSSPSSNLLSFPELSSPPLSRIIKSIKALLSDVVKFSKSASGVTLRRYQVDVARAVVDSVIRHQGLSFVVMFPRQSGKNELQAQIEVYLLAILSLIDAEIVKVSPTWKPQSLNAMRRLERVLQANLFTHNYWSKESGYIYRFGSARLMFFSGQPEANIVGATASHLLEVDEAQDVLPSKFDKDIAPMAASTNATRIFWGTAWTSRTLLARELRASLAAEKDDGIKRTFVLTADQVAKEVPAYAKFVAEQVARLGRTNPMVRTQYFSEEIDAEGSLFNPARIALIQGSHPPQLAPTPGSVYAFLVDVAGQDESAADPGAELANPGRDSTTLTIVDVDLSTLADEIIHAPTYKVVQRLLWTGAKHTAIYSQIKSLADTWSPRHLVIDATGIGAGLASFFDKAFPGRVIPYTFNAATKSTLGWNFITVIDSGRFKDYCPNQNSSQPEIDLRELFLRQLQLVTYEIQPGPEKKIRWSVPDGTRDPATGELVHDDLVLSAALVAALDELDWSLNAPTLVIHFPDPLQELDHGF